MSNSKNVDIAGPDLRELVGAFRATSDRLPPDPTAKALFGGVNIRLNVAKVFEAAWTATKIWVKVHAAGATAGLSLIDGTGARWRFLRAGDGDAGRHPRKGAGRRVRRTCGPWQFPKWHDAERPPGQVENLPGPSA